jgi:alcohol dehydrogenase
MKALVRRGARISLEDKPTPKIQEATDAVLKIVYTTICGSDLHILQGHVPTVLDGTTIGHEGVGVVEEAGDAVRRFKKGDRVLISCISSCASCGMCKKGMYSHCGEFSCGWRWSELGWGRWRGQGLGRKLCGGIVWDFGGERGWEFGVEGSFELT